jgi:four helix bundle protein
MKKKYLKLNDIDCYKRALALSQYIWEIVNKWNWFPKRTIGVQYVTSIDSISSTIAEGFGRYFKKDKVLFYRYSLGSVAESLDWTQKSWKRKLLSEKQYRHILKELQELPKEVRQLINYTFEKLER